MSNAPGAQLLAALERARRALEDSRHAWALVGGLAVTVRTEPRFTRDVDLAVAVADDAEAEVLVSSICAQGFELILSLEQEAIGRLATVRLNPPHSGPARVVIDLLFASSGIEPEICAAAEPIEIAPGLTVPVARAGHLVAMKLLAEAPDRPQDALDLHALRKVVDLEEIDRAREAVALIEARGTNRRRTIRADFDRWLARK